MSGNLNTPAFHVTLERVRERLASLVAVLGAQGDETSKSYRIYLDEIEDLVRKVTHLQNEYNVNWDLVIAMRSVRDRVTTDFVTDIRLPDISEETKLLDDSEKILLPRLNEFQTRLTTLVAECAPKIAIVETEDDEMSEDDFNNQSTHSEDDASCLECIHCGLCINCKL